MKAVRPDIASNGVHYIQMRSVGSYSTSRMEREGTKERVVGEDSVFKYDIEEIFNIQITKITDNRVLRLRRKIIK